jgi:lipid-binding SYLF domain-containing protein
MKTFLFTLLALTASQMAIAQTSDEARRITDASTVLEEIMEAADKSVPRSIMEKAEGIAVFPSLIKGGIVVGAQFGAQAIDLVLVINNQRGLEQLVKNQFKIGADAAVTAGPVGRDASASTDLQMRAQILSYSRARGLFAGVTLNGATIRQDRDANERFYGMGYRTGQIVFDGLGGSPEPVAKWKETLTKYAQ